jgi:hypothetical protein
MPPENRLEEGPIEELLLPTKLRSLGAAAIPMDYAYKFTGKYIMEMSNLQDI